MLRYRPSIPRSSAWLWFTAALVLLAAAAAIVVPEVTDARDRERMARVLTGGDPQNAPALLQRYGCSGCHTISSLPGADGKVGPPLDHLRERVFIAGVLNNTSDNLIRFIVSPQSTVPGAMPNSDITESEARDVAAYLYAR